MSKPRRLVVAASIALLAACNQTPEIAETPVVAAPVAAPAGPAATTWFADVRAMADADAGAGRRTAIQQRLDALDIDWRRSPFEIKDESGENILADVTIIEAPLLLLGAHSDQVSVGEGATDNASGSATVLALAERFKRNPLKNHRVAVAFWDLEERGLLGARAYVADAGKSPALYVNFDVFGWGDTLWMMTPDASHPLAAASQAASSEAGLKLSAGKEYPPTDHRAFLDAGWPAVSYSLLGSEEIAPILDAYAGRKPASMPKVMQVIHSNNDTIAQIDANAAGRGVDAVEDALRRWDAAAGVPAMSQ